MEFRTPVHIPRPDFRILPLQPILFVGSCFADSIGRRFQEEHFPVQVNPFGVMYNPVSVLHTIQRVEQPFDIVFLTLGTNHVYRLLETGEIVDNCQKRPQHLFSEEQLSVEDCVESLSQAVRLLADRRPQVRVVVTVSPIRYAKYGFHGSQLSKAVLLLATHQLEQRFSCVTYFPAYEIVLDELRDYRFYQPDMLHPSSQTVDYIWERLAETYFDDQTHRFLAEWQPIKKALAHRPFHPDAPEYQRFLADAKAREQELLQRYEISRTRI